MNFENKVSLALGQSLELGWGDGPKTIPSVSVSSQPNPFPLEFSKGEGQKSLSQKFSQVTYINQLPVKLQSHIFKYLSLDDTIYALAAIRNEIQTAQLTPEMQQLLIKARAFSLVSFWSDWVDFNFDLLKIEYLIETFPKIRFENLESMALSIKDISSFWGMRERFPALQQVKLKEIQSIQSNNPSDLYCRFLNENKDKVTALELTNTDSLEGLEIFSNLQNLSLLSSGCTTLQFHANMPCLSTLTLEDCDEFEALSGVEHLSKIRIYEGSAFENLKGLGYRPALKEVELEACHRLATLEGLEALPNLSRLSLVSCLRLQSLSYQGEDEAASIFDNLRELCLDNSNISTLEDLQCFPGLVKLSLMCCEKLETLDGLELCPQLRVLELKGGWNLENVEALKKCPYLTQVRLVDYCQPIFIKGLKHCSGIKEICIKRIGNPYTFQCIEKTLETLPNLSKLILEDYEDTFDDLDLDKLKARGVEVVIC